MEKWHTLRHAIESKIDSIKIVSGQKHLSEEIKNKSLISLTYQLLELLKMEKSDIKSKNV